MAQIENEGEREEERG